MAAPEQFYLDQVANCAEAASHSTLANERDKFLRAQGAWQALADRERKSRLAKARRQAEELAAAQAAAV